MNYHQFLFEAIEDFQSKKFKQLESGTKKEEFNIKKASEGINTFEDLKNIVDETDPTRGGTYKRWLYDKWFSGGFKTEDKDKVKDYLKSFHANRTKLPKEFQDIGKIKTSGELFAVLKDNGFIGLETSKIDPAAISKLEANGDIEPLGENEEWIGWIIKTLKGSCALGKDTEWCTAKYGEQDERNMFSRYHGQGPLYVFIRKTSGTPSKIQLHFYTNQFMDENDEPIEIPPKVLDILKENIEKLSENARVYLLLSIAEDPKTLPDVLDKLANDSSYYLRMIVVKNPNVSNETLGKLAKDKKSKIRSLVAGNPKTPLTALQSLATDEEKDVREALASNTSPDFPQNVLDILSQDTEENVRLNVANNPNTSFETLESLYELDSSASVGAAAAANFLKKTKQKLKEPLPESRKPKKISLSSIIFNR